MRANHSTPTHSGNNSLKAIAISTGHTEGLARALKDYILKGKLLNFPDRHVIIVLKLG